MGELIFLPTPNELGKQLTPEQKEHWEQQLLDAEKAREIALRMLGRLSLEKGLQG